MTELFDMVFDCETGPAPDSQLALIKPAFVANRTLKDPEKVKNDLAEKEAAWTERAALSALTGQVLAIGTNINDTVTVLTGSEVEMIQSFWGAWKLRGRIIGFNCKDFDLRFLVMRSRILGIDVPDDLFSGRYWNGRIIDLLELWNCYSRDYTGHSLGAVCAACGLGSKQGSGADFAKLFAEDRPAAISYIKNDIRLTTGLAQRLGVL